MSDAPKGSNAGGDEAKKGLLGKPHFDWIAYIVVPLLVAGISVLSTMWVTKYANRLRALEYRITRSSGLLRRPDIPGKEIKILIDDKQIDNVSTVSLAIYNTSDVDWEDLPVAVTFLPHEGKPPKLIQSRAQLHPERSTLLPTTQPSANAEKTLACDYMIKVANRSEEPVMTADYTFEGADAPEVGISLRKKGLEIREMGHEGTLALGLWCWCSAS
jgi:hypothetical protein